jgi:hypothetical protein
MRVSWRTINHAPVIALTDARLRNRRGIIRMTITTITTVVIRPGGSSSPAIPVASRAAAAAAAAAAPVAYISLENGFSTK